MLTAETLAELRRLLDECQPGRVIVNDLRPTHNAIWLDSRYDSDDGWKTLRTLAEIDAETETVEVLWGLDDAVLIAAAVNALPALLDAAAERDALAADRDALLAIIDDARHALSADGPKVEPARQVLARALPQITAWQDRTRHARDNTPPHVIAHRGAQLDAVTAERDALAEECDGWRHLADVRAARIARVRALHRPAYNDSTRSPICPDCDGRAGVHPCGCWSETDYEPVCAVCNEGHKGMSVPYPCQTILALDADA